MEGETREPRPDETEEQKTVEGHVQGVEHAVDHGMLTRKQAERVAKAGLKGVKSHDMTRGISQRSAENEILCR